jgi:DNA-binding MarR family transcriptional regulator
MATLSDADYALLLELRSGLRRFLAWSEGQADAVGLTPAQHQLLLAVRGHVGDRPPTIGEVAQHLLLRHHSAVGLVDRSEAAGLVRRVADAVDHRLVRVELTERGSRALADLSAAHLQELARLAPTVGQLWVGLAEP